MGRELTASSGNTTTLRERELVVGKWPQGRAIRRRDDGEQYRPTVDEQKKDRCVRLFVCELCSKFIIRLMFPSVLQPLINEADPYSLFAAA